MFIGWARQQIDDSRSQRLFDRMASRSGIAHRWSVLPTSHAGGSQFEGAGFYGEDWPGTGKRMQIYAHEAPSLAQRAVADLASKADLGGVTHIVVASCTGFVAPGIDQILAARLGLAPNVERLLIGYMGCYAAVVALRSARHIVRSAPDARVLVICAELCTLHLQNTGEVEPLLAMLQFGDGAAAALVSAEQRGIALGQPFSAALPDSEHLIRWDMGDHGFAMHLSGAVPGAISAALGGGSDKRPLPCDPASIDSWAVHPGGRSILDAVEQGLGLNGDALNISRSVLESCANMSSATLMFVLERILRGKKPESGLAMAFGPGVAVEGFSYSGADTWT